MKKATLVLVLAMAVIVLMPYGGSLTIPSSNIKTVEFFIGQATGAALISGATQSFTFSFNIPENYPEARYAYIEIQGVSLGIAGDAKLTINLNNRQGNAFFLGDGLAESQRFLIRYPFYPQIVKGTNGPYTLNINHVLATNTISALNAKLVLTYEYDSTSPLQVKTVKFFAGQTNTSFATGVKQTLNYSIFIPESNINVTSGFLEINGVANGITGMVLGVGQNSKAPIAVTLGLGGSTTAFALLYNATELHTLKTSGTQNFNVSVNGTITSGVVSGWGATAILTYEYNGTEANQLNTVKYLIGSQNTSVATATLVSNTFVVPVAENLTTQSAWIKYGAWTGALTIADPVVTLGIDDNANKKYFYDFTLDGSNFVILLNATQLYNITGNKTEGPFTFKHVITATGHTNQLGAAELFLTYNYSTSVSVTKTKTVEYGNFNFKAPLQATTTALVADNIFFTIMPENNISMKSAYLDANVVDGTTAAHWLNLSLDGNTVNFQSGGTSGETTFDRVLYNLSTVHNSSTGINGRYTIGVGTSGLAALFSGTVITTYFFRQ